MTYEPLFIGGSHILLRIWTDLTPDFSSDLVKQSVIFRLQSKDLFRTQMKYIQDGRTSKHMAPNMQRGLAN